MDDIQIGDRVEINSPRSFEYHGLQGVIKHIRIDSKGKVKYDVRMDWGSFKEFSRKSLIPIK